jgi:hypothetical protein
MSDLPMSTIAQQHNLLASIEADIANAERSLAHELSAIIVLLKKGEGTQEAEKRMREHRFTLEGLRALRRQHVRAGVSAPARSFEAHREHAPS